MNCLSKSIFDFRASGDLDYARQAVLSNYALSVVFCCWTMKLRPTLY